MNDAQHGDPDRDWLERLGDEVRLARLKRKLSQQDLADLADIRANTLIDLEKGRRWPNLLTLLHLANALEVDIRTLLPVTKRD